MLTIESGIHLSVIAVAYLAMLFYCIRFVLRYKHKFESNKLCTAVVILCLIVVLLSTLLLPADIFLTSWVKNLDGSLKDWATKETLATIDQAIFISYYG